MGITNYTEITITGWDKVRILFGRKIKLYTDIETTSDVEVVSTKQSCRVDPIIKRAEPKGMIHHGKVNA